MQKTQKKKPLFAFLSNRPLWVHLLVGVGLVIIIVLLFLQSLDWMTMHGKTLTIPSVTGKTYSEAVKTLEEQGFDVMIQDSVYVDTAAPQLVIRQFPEADATVKRNRTVYLTINRAVPPLVEMPQLEGLSFRSAQVALKQYGLVLGDTTYETNFARNSVLAQKYNGDRIKPGTKIHMGSVIDLVLGDGGSGIQVPIPNLYGMTLAEARVILESRGLMVDVIYPPDLANNPNAYVYKQEPQPRTPDGRPNTMSQGQLVDLFLQLEQPVSADTTSRNPASDY
jgi:beta-lactam-binding protein with PASTA domain